ncbi:tetrapyrrole (Corrin/Porphyrin) Methylases [alpha proteobacterium Q-1]|nr:tetrapyrrole (Corrin/Porphyrin) Methylases [alpha proteobacterium Q-1]
MTRKTGSLVAVGTGMMLGAQISPIAKTEIMRAEKVFSLVDGIAEKWLEQLSPHLESLQSSYAVGRFRPDSYREMVERVMAAVRAGQRVCIAAYGHPGIFACVPHWAIEAARAEGYEARMEPGISADACLYADLGLDPGSLGSQCYEATHYLLYRQHLNPYALLILWQVGLTGETSLTRFESDPVRLNLLVEKLIADGYGPDHEVIIYEAATLALMPVRADRLALSALPDAALSPVSTLVIPPLPNAPKDAAMREKLDALMA